METSEEKIVQMTWTGRVEEGLGCGSGEQESNSSCHWSLVID